MTAITSAGQQRIARATLTYLAGQLIGSFAGYCRCSAPLTSWQASGLAPSPLR
jgi:hypothetical protein